MLDTEIGTIATNFNVPERITYITTIKPVDDPDKNFLFGGGSYTLIGMEYDKHRYGYQFAIGGGNTPVIKHRALFQGSWQAWKTCITNTDLHKVTHKKNFGGFSANSMREFLIAVINKVLENNLWTSPEDVIVFCATWFGNSYGMGILASQNSNNDIIISYDSEDGNSYTMHYVPSTNTVKAFYKRQGTSLL